MSDIDNTNKYTELFNNFSDELQNWSDTLEIPKSASQDLKYFFSLRTKRLEKFNLDYEYRLEQVGPKKVASSSLSILGNMTGLNDSDDNCFQKRKDCIKREQYIYNGKRIYNKAKNIILCQIIYNPDEQKEDISEISYTCPNCGAISKIKDLQEKGCPYCRTKYVISDLFPRVINFYTVESMKFDEEKTKLSFKKSAFIIFLVAIVLSIFSELKGFLNEGIKATLPSYIGHVFAYFICFGLLAYIIWAFRLIGKLMVGAAKTIPYYEYIGAKQKITDKLKQYDGIFDYEYFEGKIISLIRNIVLSEDATNYSQYVGSDVDKRFKNIVDIEYTTAMKLLEDYIQDDYLYIKMQVYLSNTYFINNQIVNQKDIFYITIKHNTKFKIDKAFSISEVNCKTCGASFNAKTEKKCPYCHNDYQLEDEDWVVTDIRYYV